MRRDICTMCDGEGDSGDWREANCPRCGGSGKEPNVTTQTANVMELLRDIRNAMKTPKGSCGTLWPAPFEPSEGEHGYDELLARIDAVLAGETR